MPDGTLTLTDSFQDRFRRWLEHSYPEAWKQDAVRPFRRLRGSDVRQWIAALGEAGWRCPGWPTEYGGMGLNFQQQLAYQDELERVRAARVIDLGEVQLGPTLMLHGTLAQKAEYLPAILSGDHIWCQGYSEPGAGSDLASLKTVAVRDGDHLRVTGQKIWTTHASESTHMFALVRTSRSERKQHGITFLLIDMATSGVTVRPINNLAGEDEFCEVFLDDVRVPIANIVGEIDEGWTVAKSLLGYERVWIGNPGLCARALDVSRALVAATSPDLGLMDRYAECAADLHDVRALYNAICDRVGDGQEPGPEVSMLKILSSELLQRLAELNLELGADAATLQDGQTIGGQRTDLAWQYLMSRPQAIFAGSNEIQRNVLAKAVLGLGH